MCIASYAGTNRYQVSCPFGEQFVVDMAGKTCSCRKWQLRGIPCGHAVACINRRHEQPEQHVSHTYLKTTYVASYDPVLNPINGPNLWEHINLQPMKPPNFGRSPGRPKKMRKKGPGEEARTSKSCVNPNKPHKVSKVGTKMSCSLCKKYGHNKRSCPTNKKSANETGAAQQPVTTQDGMPSTAHGATGDKLQSGFPSNNNSTAQEPSKSGLTADVGILNTQESISSMPQDEPSNQPTGAEGQPPIKKARKCSFGCKYGHSKNNCKYRQWTFRNSLDMTGELGLKGATHTGAEPSNPYTEGANIGVTAKEATGSTHVSQVAEYNLKFTATLTNHFLIHLLLFNECS